MIAVADLVTHDLSNSIDSMIEKFGVVKLKPAGYHTRHMKGISWRLQLVQCDLKPGDLILVIRQAKSHVDNVVGVVRVLAIERIQIFVTAQR